VLIGSKFTLLYINSVLFQKKKRGPRGGSNPDLLSALTPKLTGRANAEVAIRNYQTSDKPLYRLQLLWMSVWPSGGSNSCHQTFQVYIPGTYRLGVLCEIEVSPDGLARTVPVPLHENVGHDRQQTGFAYPVEYDEVKKIYVWDSTAPGVSIEESMCKKLQGLLLLLV
jgi:hypothetical protein